MDEQIKFLLLTVLITLLSFTAIITTFYIDEIMSLIGIENFPLLFEPSAALAFQDFFGDQVLFGLLIMTLGSMGVLSSDIESGAISFSLTRPISRKAYTASRITARILALTVPFIIGSSIGWIYVNVMFDPMPLGTLFGAMLPLVILFMYMGFVTAFFSSRLSGLNAGLVTIAVLIFQFTIAILEPIEYLSPFALSNFWVELLIDPSFVWSFGILGKLLGLCLWTVVPFVATLISMDRRDL
jgi:ABC-type transport system involved in multi-copper enzyme maturation permease subunit